jgi:hypothetical protein
MSSKPETKAEARLRAETEDMVPPKDKAEAIELARETHVHAAAGKKTDKEHGDKSNPHSVRTS